MNNKLTTKIKKFLSKFRKIKTDDLKNVVGAGEPEEFDWKGKDYITPVKDQHKDGQWDFGPIDADNKWGNKQ